jgi:hypothetical protein
LRKWLIVNGGGTERLPMFWIPSMQQRRGKEKKYPKS